MARMSKFLVIFLLGLGLSGCATYYNIKVNGYTAPKTAEQLKPGGFFYIMEDKEAKNPLLETEVREKIVRLLEGHGYPVTSSFDKADYYLFFKYGMGQPQSVGVTDYYGSVGWGFGWGGGWGWGYGGPSVGIWAPPYGSTEIVTLYDRWLQINVVDGPLYRTQKVSRSVWVGEARSHGTSSDLRTTLNYLLVALFNHFGQNTGKVIDVKLKQNDPAVSVLAH
jgi:hypothetical protein